MGKKGSSVLCLISLGRAALGLGRESTWPWWNTSERATFCWREMLQDYQLQICRRLEQGISSCRCKTGP